MRRRKEPVNYALFLCFSIPGQVRGKIGKAEREKALLKEGTQDEFFNVKVTHYPGLLAEVSLYPD